MTRTAAICNITVVSCAEARLYHSYPDRQFAATGYSCAETEFGACRNELAFRAELHENGLLGECCHAFAQVAGSAGV